MAHNGKTTNSSGWTAVFSWIKYALTGKRDESVAVAQSSVNASSLVDLDARVKAIEKVLASLDVDDAEDLSVYKVLQSAKTFSPDRTKTLSAMSQNDNGEMSATFAEVQATVASQNDYTSPESTKTALSTIFGKIWNFIGRLRTSWQTTPDNTHFPSEKLVKDSLDTKANKSEMTITAVSGDSTKKNIQLKNGLSQDVVVDISCKQDAVYIASAGTSNPTSFSDLSTAIESGKTVILQYQNTSQGNGQILTMLFSCRYLTSGQVNSYEFFCLDDTYEITVKCFRETGWGNLTRTLRNKLDADTVDDYHVVVGEIGNAANTIYIF